jgi:hypothetical protein
VVRFRIKGDGTSSVEETLAEIDNCPQDQMVELEGDVYRFQVRGE